MGAILDPILWLVGVLLFYLNLGAFGVAAALCFNNPKPPRIVALLLTIAAPICCYWLLGKNPPTGICVAGGLALAISYGYYRFVLAPTLDWQSIKFKKEASRQTLLHLVLASGSILFLVPFAWLVSTSLKEDKEMSKFPPVWIPTQQVKVLIDGVERGKATVPYQGQTVTVAVIKEFDTGVRAVRVLEPQSLAGKEFECKKADITEIRTVNPVWKNYPNALKFLPQETLFGLVFLKNTLIVSMLNIIGTLLASSMVAYGFARLRWPGRKFLFIVLLATMMLPAAVTMMPVFLIFRAIGWVDTLQPLWVPAFFGAPYFIFLLRQFFLTIPTELEDAAKIDGCSHYTIFWRIMLPQIKPALAAITIMTFMGAWNDFRGPLIYISSPENQTLSYALQLFQTTRGGEPGLLMAASTMVIIPVVILFFFTQRYFIQGITLTGLKG